MLQNWNTDKTYFCRVVLSDSGSEAHLGGGRGDKEPHFLHLRQTSYLHHWKSFTFVMKLQNSETPFFQNFWFSPPLNDFLGALMQLWIMLILSWFNIKSAMGGKIEISRLNYLKFMSHIHFKGWLSKIFSPYLVVWKIVKKRKMWHFVKAL